MSASDKPASYYAGCNENLLRAVPPDARRVLEVGCGEGRLGAALKRQDPTRTVLGVEREPEVAARAAEHLDRVFRLDVEARTRSGRTAEPVSYAFSVRPLWYQTPWAWALAAMCAAGLLGAGLALVRWRGRGRLQIASLLCLLALAFVPLLLNSLVDSHPIQQGRYLFPVLPAVAILMALGQEALLPARWRAGWLIIWLGFWLTFAAAALVRLAAAYR